jgi:hypothetical protein
VDNDRMTTDAEALSAAAYKQTATVAGAIVASLLMYVVVAEVLSRTPASAGVPAFLGPLRIALFVIAGIAIFLTTIIKGIMLRNAPADAGSRLARLRTATFTALALCELPAISGLILVVVGRTRSDFYMLLAISTYMMVRHFPRRMYSSQAPRRGRTTAIR